MESEQIATGNGAGEDRETRHVPAHEEPSDLAQLIAELEDDEGSVRVLQRAIETDDVDSADLAGAAASIAARLDNIGLKLCTLDTPGGAA